MALETVPAGVVSDGNGLVLFVPTIADPTAPTTTELTAGTVKKLTYSITGDGYKHDITVNTVTINRLTLKQVLQYDGTVTDDLEITYVWGLPTTGDIARLALPVGTTGYIVERWNVANGTAPAVGDIVDVIPIKAGLQRKNAPTANAENTITQKLNVTGTVNRFVVLAS
jgi:hypothetical protein